MTPDQVEFITTLGIYDEPYYRSFGHGWFWGLTGGDGNGNGTLYNYRGGGVVTEYGSAEQVWNGNGSGFGRWK